ARGFPFQIHYVKPWRFSVLQYKSEQKRQVYITLPIYKVSTCVLFSGRRRYFNNSLLAFITVFICCFGPLEYINGRNLFRRQLLKRRSGGFLPIDNNKCPVETTIGYR